MTLVPLSSVCTVAVAFEPFTMIVLIVSVKSPIVFSCAVTAVVHLVVFPSPLTIAVSNTFLQMSAALAPLASLASRLSATAT